MGGPFLHWAMRTLAWLSGCGITGPLVPSTSVLSCTFSKDASFEAERKQMELEMLQARKPNSRTSPPGFNSAVALIFGSPRAKQAALSKVTGLLLFALGESGLGSCCTEDQRPEQS